MKREDKQLLLQDLCSRLPYRVKVQIPIMNDAITLTCGDISAYFFSPDNKVFPKPYLRPMSSMTEEESAELSNIISEWFDKELFYLTEEPFLEYALSRINYTISPLLFDWLNAHHFDFRNLLSKGLAIEVTEDNNPYKD